MAVFVSTSPIAVFDGFRTGALEKFSRRELNCYKLMSLQLINSKLSNLPYYLSVFFSFKASPGEKR